VARRRAAADRRGGKGSDAAAVVLHARARGLSRVPHATLTNFKSGLGARLAFHFIGFGLGSRRHADRQGAYDSLRSSGFLGLCLSEQKVGNPLRAREYCQRALKHAPNDPIGHFLLGNVNRDLYNVRHSCDYLKAARTSYAKMIEINPDLDESRNAKNYLGQIDGILPKLGCRG
jgi:tetratricopeptide (TPR) repeat protein